MKKLTLLFLTLSLLVCCKREAGVNSDDTTLPGYTNYTYAQALNKLGIQLDVFYNYKGVYTNDPVGKIKFNSDQTITEVYNNTTANFSYQFSSNNQNDTNQLSIHFKVLDNSVIPNYSPKMPVTSLAKHFGFDIHKADNYGVKKIHIGGLYSYADPSDYEKVILIQ